LENPCPWELLQKKKLLVVVFCAPWNCDFCSPCLCLSVFIFPVPYVENSSQHSHSPFQKLFWNTFCITPTPHSQVCYWVFLSVCFVNPYSSSSGPPPTNPFSPISPGNFFGFDPKAEVGDWFGPLDFYPPPVPPLSRWGTKPFSPQFPVFKARVPHMLGFLFFDFCFFFIFFLRPL